MTCLQQALWSLESDYFGHPYYVPGHALYTAIARRVDGPTRAGLAVSMGQFVSGAIGAYPDQHSQTQGSPYIGTSLHPVETYADLWLFRDPAHRWLSTAQPRSALNTHDLHDHAGRQTFAPQTTIGQPAERRVSTRTTTWHVQATLHANDESILPLDEEILDGLQVGGGRNYGFGRLKLVDTQCVEPAELTYPHLQAAEDYTIELRTPYVLSSTVPGADEQSIPWWWDIEGELRRREERLVIDGQCHKIETVDHGQRIGYAGDRPIETAKNGLTRVGTHAKFGYGEFRLRPVGEVPTASRVPEHGGTA